MELKKKRIKPCKECPFARNNNSSSSHLGGADVTTYIGQSIGPFWLPCHMEKAYNGKKTEPKAVSQCAGAAIYRSNIDLPYSLPKELLSLPEDHDKVFSSHAEFLSHYTKAPLDACQKLLRPNVLKKLLHDEMYKIEVRKVKL